MHLLNPLCPVCGRPASAVQEILTIKTPIAVDSITGRIVFHGSVDRDTIEADWDSHKAALNDDGTVAVYCRENHLWDSDWDSLETVTHDDGSITVYSAEEVLGR